MTGNIWYDLIIAAVIGLIGGTIGGLIFQLILEWRRK